MKKDIFLILGWLTGHIFGLFSLVLVLYYVPELAGVHILAIIISLYRKKYDNA